MPYSPPKKSTILFSFLIMFIGIILGVIGVMGQMSVLIPGTIIFGLDADQLFILIGFLLVIIAWLLMFLGVLFRGI